jgi:hypothetical protein
VSRVKNQRQKQCRNHDRGLTMYHGVKQANDGFKAIRQTIHSPCELKTN